MTVRVGVTGATGRMGQEVLAAVAEREDCEVVLAVNRDPDGETIDGVEIEPASEFDSLVVDREPTAVIDFTGPESAPEYAAACSEAGVPFVTGTTGFEDDEREELEAASDEIPSSTRRTSPAASRRSSTSSATSSESRRLRRRTRRNPPQSEA